jgi:hypothetical protein
MCAGAHPPQRGGVTWPLLPRSVGFRAHSGCAIMIEPEAGG